MIAFVVPITRLRRHTTGWSYQIPKGAACQAGSLVVIPFRGHDCLGVVWETRTVDERATATISQILTSTPLVRQPHRQLIEWLSEKGVCSLSSSLYQWMPRGLRELPLSSRTRELLHLHDTDLQSAVQLTAIHQHAVCLPGRRPIQETSLQRKFTNQYASLFADQTERQEIEAWFAIARGEATIAAGRERAIFAPWLNLRQLTLVEPEDISYYHEQCPYLNLVEAAQKLAELYRITPTVRSYLPPTGAQLLWGASTTGSTIHTTSCTIIDLSRDPILHPDLIAAIARAEHEVLILYNARDRLVETPDIPGSKKLLPGIQTVRKQLAQALGKNTLPDHITVDTRAMFQSPHPRVGLAVALNIDALLETSLFADLLHGWTDLGHLLSYSCPLFVQSHYPAHPLIEALRNGQFERYTQERITRQRELGLPPFSQQVVCSFPVEDDGEVYGQKLFSELEQLLTAPWQISHPFAGLWRKKAYIHILLTAPATSRLPEPVRAKLAVLKRPWKVQHNPWHIL